jgi:hypothetical protein
VTTLAAVGASVASYLYFLHRGVTLAYPDAVSHLLIARRVIDSPTVGVAQLGAVWLPLPHLLSLPFIWVNAWYYSGFAGSLISMIAYVLTVRYAYLIARGLTGTRVGGVVAAVAFGANPNVLYLQSTAMTELLLIGCVAAAVYYLMRWCQTGRYIDLATTATAALLASLTRYEGWVLCLAMAPIVAYVTWQRAGLAGGSDPAADGRARLLWSRLQAVEANLIFYACLAASGVAGWVLWNQVIFHDPFYFQTGPFAKPSLWVSHSEKAIGHLGVSALTYLYAMADNAGALTLVLGAAGFAYYLVRTRFRIDAIAPLALTAFVPFYVYALYSGQRPIHIAQIGGSLYNVRFGVLMVFPTAIFMSFLVTAVTNSNRAWLRRGVFAALLAGSVASTGLVVHGGIDTLKEAVAFRAAPSEQANAAAGRWLRSHYDGGKVLMESFGNETVTFASRIPLGQIVYEGSFRQWEPDLAFPASNGIRWIYMPRTPGTQDQVFRTLHGSAQLDSYRLVYQDPGRLIYERRGFGQPIIIHRIPHKSSRRSPSVVLKPVSASSFDALGNGAVGEDSSQAINAIDNSPSSIWQTDFYYTYPTFGNLKKGTGLILDMGKQVRLSQVLVQFGTSCCAHVEIEIGNNNNPVPSALSTFTQVQGSDTAAGLTTFNVTKKTTGRYVLIWLTYLPPMAGFHNQYQAQIYNVVVHGSAVSQSA